MGLQNYAHIFTSTGRWNQIWVAKPRTLNIMKMDEAQKKEIPSL